MTETTRSAGRFEDAMADEPNDIAEPDEDEDDDGPPPGFDCIAWPTESQKVAAEEQNVDKVEEERVDDADEDEDEDVDGPPPGWSPIPQAHQTTHTPVQLTCVQHSDLEMSEKQDAVEDEDDGPPPGWDFVPPSSQAAEGLPTDREIGSHQEGARGSDERAQPGDKIVPTPQLLPPTPPPLQAQASSSSEKGQMICGSCRQLLSYSRGVKYVQCSCCQTVNLVLEAHQVGQVKCGGCAVLLMYPDGAPSVRCSSCCFVTDIGAHNRRPPLSAQQARRLPSLNPVH